MSEPERLLTRREAAYLMHKSPSTLARWARIGYGPPYLRVANQVLYRPDVIRDWLADQEVDPR